MSDTSNSSTVVCASSCRRSLRQRARSLNLATSQPNLSSSSDEKEVSETSQSPDIVRSVSVSDAIDHLRERCTSNPNLQSVASEVENGRASSSKSEKSEHIGGPRRRSTLIAQWEQMIQGAETTVKYAAHSATKIWKCDCTTCKEEDPNLLPPNTSKDTSIYDFPNSDDDFIMPNRSCSLISTRDLDSSPSPSSSDNDDFFLFRTPPRGKEQEKRPQKRKRWRKRRAIFKPLRRLYETAPPHISSFQTTLNSVKPRERFFPVRYEVVPSRNRSYSPIPFWERLAQSRLEKSALETSSLTLANETGANEPSPNT